MATDKYLVAVHGIHQHVRDLSSANAVIFDRRSLEYHLRPVKTVCWISKMSACNELSLKTP